MARILIAWEMGANLGHVGQILPLARALRDSGHLVQFAFKEDPVILSAVSRTGYSLFKAPVVWQERSLDKLTAAIGVSRTLDSYGDLLRLLGWVDPSSLGQALRGWRDLFQITKPDLLICHAAPTAQLAAFGLPLRVARLGTGFECPPLNSPFLPMQYWKPARTSVLLDRERELVACVREALRQSGQEGIETPDSLAGFLRPTADLLCTVAELDHYPGRTRPAAAPSAPKPGESTMPDNLSAPFPRASYYGPLLTVDQGLEPEWPGNGGPRILAYLRPPFAAAMDLLRAMRQGPWSTLLVMPGLRPEQARELASTGLNVATAPVRMDHAIGQATAVISHGGHGTVAGSLLAGRPILNLPKNTEQILVSRHAAQTGAASVVSSVDQGQEFSMVIQQLVESDLLAAKACAFATKYRDLRLGMHGVAVNDAVTDLLRAHPDVRALF